MQFSSAEGGRGHPEPSPEQVQAWHRKIDPPDNELPGAIPFHAVLAKTDGLAVALAGADAYSTGISIEIAIRLRRADQSPYGFHADPYDPGGTGLLVGVAYPDGRTASNVSNPHCTVALGGRLRVEQTLMSDLVDSEDIVCAGWVPVSP